MKTTTNTKGNAMTYRIEFVDDLMTVVDADGNGHDAFVVDPKQPLDGLETITDWTRRYDFNIFHALLKLRAHLHSCKTNN